MSIINFQELFSFNLIKELFILFLVEKSNSWLNCIFYSFFTRNNVVHFSSFIPVLIVVSFAIFSAGLFYLLGPVDPAFVDFLTFSSRFDDFMQSDASNYHPVRMLALEEKTQNIKEVLWVEKMQAHTDSVSRSYNILTEYKNNYPSILGNKVDETLSRMDGCSYYVQNPQIDAEKRIIWMTRLEKIV